MPGSTVTSLPPLLKSDGVLRTFSFKVRTVPANGDTLVTLADTVCVLGDQLLCMQGGFTPLHNSLRTCVHRKYTHTRRCVHICK